ncbi:hypothetical protein PR048_021634 [Dryococelus australis]|uniref:Uncharacterized protein n=1 Tax=Dryococelus australis TaxID=614101 RepID=A0ABQ9GYT0_9NEOP|nr:hypothetical protein PR048_021634 [Dryococelus australis]
MKVRGKREIPEKTRRPTASCGTIPSVENPETRDPAGSPCLEETFMAVAYLEIFAAFETEKRGNDKCDTATHIKCTIAAKRKTELACNVLVALRVPTGLFSGGAIILFAGFLSWRQAAKVLAVFHDAVRALAGRKSTGGVGARSPLVTQRAARKARANLCGGNESWMLATRMPSRSAHWRVTEPCAPLNSRRPISSPASPSHVASCWENHLLQVSIIYGWVSVVLASRQASGLHAFLREDARGPPGEAADQLTHMATPRRLFLCHFSTFTLLAL